LYGSYVHGNDAGFLLGREKETNNTSSFLLHKAIDACFPFELIRAIKVSVLADK